MLFYTVKSLPAKDLMLDDHLIIKEEIFRIDKLAIQQTSVQGYAHNINRETEIVVYFTAKHEEEITILNQLT